MTRGEAGPLHITRHFESVPRVAMLAARPPVTAASLGGGALLPLAFSLAPVAVRTIPPFRSRSTGALAGGAVALRSVAPLGFRATRPLALRPIAPLGFRTARALALRPIAPLRFGTARALALRPIAPLRFGTAWALALRPIAPLRLGTARALALRSIAPLGFG